MPQFRRLTLLVGVLGVAALVSLPGLGRGTPLGERQSIDARISNLRDQIERAKTREGVLSSEIEAATSRIRALEAEIVPLNEKVARLESELAAQRERLAELRELYRYQTRRLGILVRAHGEAQRRLEQRLVELYETEQPDTLAILFQASSLNELIEQIQLFNEIARQDRKIADEIEIVRKEMRLARQRTAATKAEATRVTAALAEKTAEERAARDALLARERALEDARAGKQGLLAGVREERHRDEEDLEAMLAASAEIAARIQGAQSSAASQGLSTGSGVSASGFIWPVQGVFTSGFGWRWGRMHEGIDIAAPSGTSIYAAASGTVIYAGWLGGYGNLTIIDHGNGVATAYGHQSAIYVTAGSVSQGQAIGAVGSTGHSTGPHVHFEIRINGTPVDPLGYL